MSFQAQSNDPSPEVIVFGGTFDPPHNGHAQMVEAALNHFGAAEVIVVPAFAPSAGGEGLKSVVASFPQRVEMARLAFAATRRVKISTVEQELSTPSFTLNTLRFVSNQVAEKRLALLLGQDQFEAFPKWHEPKAILNLADLIIIPRPREMNRDSTLAKIAGEVAENLGTSLNWKHEGVIATTQEGSNFYLLPAQVCQAVSSKIREQIKSGAATPPGWLTDSVRNYINKHQLYRNNED